MKASIYCTEPKHGGLDFYLKVGNESYYLFSQKWRQAIKDCYAGGISVDQALKASRHGNRHISDKIPVYIRYIEKEYGIAVLEKSKRRSMAC